jgi:UDP-glucose 4-epimerase
MAVVGHGFIGRRVTRSALAGGWKVRTLSRRRPDRPTAGGHEVLVGDARNGEMLQQLLSGTDHVVFAAGTTRPADSNDHPAHEISANEGPLLATLEAMPSTGTTGITLMSSGGTVYGPDAPVPTPETAPLWPISAYGVVRVASERYVQLAARQHELTADILRVANVYGPGEPSSGSQGLIGVTRAALRAGRPVVVYGDGSARRDFVHVDDVAAVVVELAGRPDGVRVLNVGSGQSVTVTAAIEAVARSLSARATLEHRPARPTDAPVVQLDLSALRALVEFQPRDLAAGLADHSV